LLFGLGGEPPGFELRSQLESCFQYGLRFFPSETVTPGKKDLKTQDEGVLVQGNSSGRRKGMREHQPDFAIRFWLRRS
jgi:hypothetical protein